MRPQYLMMQALIVYKSRSWYRLYVKLSEYFYLKHPSTGRVLYDFYNLTDDQLSVTHHWERENYPEANTVYYQELISIMDESPEVAYFYWNLMKGINLHYSGWT